MYSETTNDIEIIVEPEFLADRSRPEASRWFWAYTITVKNHSGRTVQLMHRHWRITDATGHVEEVKGLGVVGEQPILAPGETFSYTSGCPLTTPSGIMVGAYRFVDEDGEGFDVNIPAFSLDSPQGRRILN